MTVKKIMFIVGMTLLAVAVSLTGQEAKPVYFIKNATIIPMSGPEIENGGLLIENGKIKALGKDIQAPAGAEIIDASGQFVYPGFIDAYTHYGLVEIADGIAHCGNRLLLSDDAHMKFRLEVQ